LLQQVLINLLQNAKDAIEESGMGSRVAIKTSVVNIGVVSVEVSDDGPGIPEKIIDRIFDPFFTTKDVGKGTGLGLSVSRRIVEGMGGSISVVSRDGRGTVFSIALPSALSEDAGADKGEADADMGDYSCLSGKSVIVIDDEEGVVKAIKDAVEPSVGFVDCASSGAEAMEMLTDRDYDLIVLDVKMPGLGGREIYKRVSAVKPYLAERIIFITGDFESEATESFVKLTGCKYLTKPFAKKDLFDTMRAYEFDMTEVIP
jgi:two-component system NtrC family sensor kinase